MVAGAARALRSPAALEDLPERLVLSRGGTRFAWRRGKPVDRGLFDVRMSLRD
jgi:hypothetical protein